MLPVAIIAVRNVEVHDSEGIFMSQNSAITDFNR